MVIVGDSDWASNAYLGLASNSAFAAKILLWLLDEDEAKFSMLLADYVTPESESLDMSEKELYRFKLLYVFFIPALILFGLFIVWRKL
jgi:hypothetical protein